MKPSDPIGVFDSGLGGLSVVDTLRRMMPDEQILYYGDSARNPYGTKSKEQVKQYSFEIVERFRKQNVKAVIIACNTATSAAAKDLRKAFDFDIVGMEPALKPAAEMKAPSKIAVWATALTLNQEKFAHLMERFDENHEIIRVACPRLVELVEQDQLDDLETVDTALQEYLKQSEDAEFIVLGCTHFLFFKDRLKQLANDQVQIIDGNVGTIKRLHSLLAQKGLLAQNPNGSLTIDNSQPEKIDLSWKLYQTLEEKL
ncbi:glutamate racemase [Erysipelotrichaceae bacterium RD49]|nr:glutamate racemase [Erysipelotrichaceae bacterium RD49]